MTAFQQTLMRVWTLVIKELLAILKDPKSRMLLIAPPLFEFFIFGYAATFDLDNVRYAILDEDKSVESRELLARFQGSPTFRLVGAVESDREITDLINRQGARLVIHVPHDFSRDLNANQPARIQVILDGRNSNVASVALGYVNEIVARFNRDHDSKVSPASSTTAAPSIHATNIAWFNANLQSRWFIVSVLGGTISMIVVLLLTSLSVSREREFGTFDQLLVAPFRPGEILAGKAIPPMICGLFDALLVAGAGVIWFGIPFRGALFTLLIALGVFIVSIVGIGLFISSLCPTMQQSLVGAFIFAMPAVILSGFTTSISNMPPWMQIATYANPLRYIITACREVYLQGADVSSIWPQLWPMAIIASITLSAAAWLFRHRTA